MRPFNSNSPALFLGVSLLDEVRDELRELSPSRTRKETACVTVNAYMYDHAPPPSNAHPFRRKKTTPNSHCAVKYVITISTKHYKHNVAARLSMFLTGCLKSRVQKNNFQNIDRPCPRYGLFLDLYYHHCYSMIVKIVINLFHGTVENHIFSCHAYT